jgi:hypothetical protein
MKNFTIITFFSLLLYVPNLRAQDLAPLEVGNIWIYEQPSALGRITIVDTNIFINSIPYFEFSIESNYGGETDSHYVRLREDSFYVKLNNFYLTETSYYKKNAVIGDTWTVDPYLYTIADTFVANVFGEQTTVKFLTIDSGLLLIHEYWTEKFGKLSSSQFPNPWLMEELLGCVIDGVAYGDTAFTIVSVEDEFQQPESFVLKQNYPNPFNPSTTIRWQLPVSNWLTLKIYDLLGNEIATLVDGFKPAGEYEVDFDASGLASGIYFYQLRVKNYIETKKMQLLK